jgi:imidazoleglycerol-phosphate dehydratase
MKRKAEIKRKTKETSISLKIDLDGTGKASVRTGLPFFDHMLTLASKHGYFDLDIKARGDIEIDEHHLVEDIGLVFGQALTKVLKNKIGINRYGWAAVPMDEVLCLTAIDISGRPCLVYKIKAGTKKIKDFDVSVVKEFFQGLVNQSHITMHCYQLSAGGAHHTLEALFKSFGQALKQAVTLNPRQKGIPSTKGSL